MINIESTEIPDELIYHFDINNTYDNTIMNNDISGHHCVIQEVEYCKGKICACLYGDDIKPFIDFPDNKGYVHRYILVPYANGYKNIISDYIGNNNDISVSTDCRTNSQFFSNNCNNNTCTYNSESDVERCDILYTKPSVNTDSKRYNYCGRMIGELCTNDLECSFKNCDSHICSNNYYEPSESDAFAVAFEKFIFIVIIFIVIMIVLCCGSYYFIKKNK